MTESPDKKPPQDILDWLAIRNAPNWRVARLLGGVFGAILIVAVPLLFFGALLAAGTVLQHTVAMALSGRSEGINLGAGALIAALLGAPFVIWGTVLKHQTVRYQKEGHMTDRISKAVEQLGAEKTVNTEVRYLQYKRKSKGDEVFETRVRKNVKRNLPHDVCKIVAKPWETIQETVPNLEVRIGAILSLERIAQDSTTHDKGRDHVMVMQILCEYVRENSNARQPKELGRGERETPGKDTTEEEHKTHLDAVRKRSEAIQKWATSLPKPRADVQLALTVIGRRSPEQRRVEAAWPNPLDQAKRWPFDPDFLRQRDEPGKAAMPRVEFDAIKARLSEWRRDRRKYTGYRLDLRGANLQRFDLAARQPDGSDAVFSGAKMAKARLEGAFLDGAHLKDVNLANARMEGARLDGARMQGARLRETRMEGASLERTRLEGAALWNTNLTGAQGLTPEQLATVFGDASVTLPEGVERPAHWPLRKLGWSTLKAERAKWLASPSTNPPD